MSYNFFEQPILKPLYEIPTMHWELDDEGQPTEKIIANRRSAKFLIPIPKPKKRKKQQSSAIQEDLILGEGKGLSTADQQDQITSRINDVRFEVGHWRVTSETAQLLLHWRHHQFSGIRPFFCQLEAVATIIWLREAAPKWGKKGKEFIDHLANTNNDANPELMRLVLKLATGAGKTTSW